MDPMEAIRLTTPVQLQLKGKKKAELAQKSRKEIADFIANNKIERAKIKVEQIIREDYLVEAIEILENYCEILISRFGLLENSKSVDPSLAEAISSIIWVTPRLEAEIKELKDISAIFSPKCCTSTNVRLALWINCDERHANPPIIITIDQYDESMRSDSISSNGVGDQPGSSGGSQAQPKPVPSPRTSLSPSDPVLNLPNVPSDTMPDPGDSPVNNSSTDNVDFDDLTKRFEELKKKR
ncbi:IST1 homolog [Diaphorina citri]|uniref:IST1 homolog n=1 Tax=Diaphorina citri TaxID=121845 RepID=A0A3Q0J0M4_DIACI|nr:IST1 homolog [Diaphorina citri]